MHVGATTHRGAAGTDPLPAPRPPWDRIEHLVAGYLGPVRRAGRGSLPAGTRAGEDEVTRRTGFAGPTRLDVGGGEVVDRSVDEVVAAVFSLSSATPHLFAGRRAAFEADLRRLLAACAPDGHFAERTHGVAVTIWRP